jgi:hypothetical protein
MMAIEVHHAHGRRLEIFWFCGDCRKQSRLVSISCPWSGIPTIADRRQLPLGHEEGWLHVQALSPQLSAFPFDHFPRGASYGTALPINGIFTSIKSCCAALSS